MALLGCPLFPVAQENLHCLLCPKRPHSRQLLGRTLTLVLKKYPYTPNVHATGRQSGACFCATMSAAIAQKGAELWLSRRAFQRLAARACYDLVLKACNLTGRECFLTLCPTAKHKAPNGINIADAYNQGSFENARLKNTAPNDVSMI